MYSSLCVPMVTTQMLGLKMMGSDRVLTTGHDGAQLSTTHVQAVKGIIVLGVLLSCLQLFSLTAVCTRQVQ